MLRSSKYLQDIFICQALALLRDTLVKKIQESCWGRIENGGEQEPLDPQLLPMSRVTQVSTSQVLYRLWWHSSLGRVTTKGYTANLLPYLTLGMPSPETSSLQIPTMDLTHSAELQFRIESLSKVSTN
jgi:hypothetical protein